MNGFLIFALILLTSVIIFLIKVLRKEKRKEEELIAINKSQEASLRLSRETEKSWQGLRELRHDTKKHFSTIYAYLQLNNIEGLRHYLKSIFDDLDSMADYRMDIPPSLSIILGERKRYARECGILLSIQITENIFGMRDVDLARLFGNMLDNAIEAAGKLKEDSPYIELTISPSHLGMVHIECSNDTTNTFYRRKLDGTLETTKEDKKAHGLGMNIMQKILQKYDGYMKTYMDDGKFMLMAEYRRDERYLFEDNQDRCVQE